MLINHQISMNNETELKEKVQILYLRFETFYHFN